MSDSEPTQEHSSVQKPVEMFNTPAFQALFRVTATILLLFISVVAFVAVAALGDIKDLTQSINSLNIKLTELVGEGRVVSTTVNNHEGRITSLEIWRNTIPMPPAAPVRPR